MYVTLAADAGIFELKSVSATPSGPNSFIVGLAACTARHHLTALVSTIPPKDMQSAPEPLIFVARERKFAALVSMPSLATTLMPAVCAPEATPSAIPFP